VRALREDVGRWAPLHSPLTARGGPV
jgi:hypothetical protein